MRVYQIGDVLHPDEFPVIEDIYRIDASGGWRWFVVMTNPRCESRAIKSIEEAGLKAFMPTIRTMVVEHRQKVVRVRPLFPRYLFVGCPIDRRGDADLYAVRRCDGVKSLVQSAGDPLALQEEVIGDLMLGEEAGWLSLTREPMFKGQASVHVQNQTFVEAMRTVLALRPADRIAAFIRLFQKRRACLPKNEA